MRHENSYRCTYGNTCENISWEMFHSFIPVITCKSRRNYSESIEDEFLVAQFRMIITIDLGSKKTGRSRCIYYRKSLPKRKNA